MRQGKLPQDVLASLLYRVSGRDDRVQIGPRVGEDAGVVIVDAGPLIVTTDPITFVTERAGWYAVHVSANDIAAMGGTPAWFAVTVILPPSSTPESVSGLFDQLEGACREVGATIVTGHTEVSAAVDRPIVVGTMIGKAGPHGIIASSGARPGDTLLALGYAALEGTAILATEARTLLLERGVGEPVLSGATALLTMAGISVLPAAAALQRAVGPHALHDATEGGVATAALEIASASGTGLILDLDEVPLLPATIEVCSALALNPLGLISSGCLLAAVPAEDEVKARLSLEDAGLPAAAIGRFTAASAMYSRRKGELQPLVRFERDEIARFFDTEPAT